MEYTNIQYADLKGLATLFVEVFNDEPWNEKWSYASALARLTDIVNTPGFVGLKATRDAFFVGFIMGYGEPFDQGADFYVKEMGVVSSLQRKGTGTVLLGKLRETLVASGMRSIYLLTSRDGPAACFYKKNGFRVNESMIMMGQNLK